MCICLWSLSSSLEGAWLAGRHPRRQEGPDSRELRGVSVALDQDCTGLGRPRSCTVPLQHIGRVWSTERFLLCMVMNLEFSSRLMCVRACMHDAWDALSCCDVGSFPYSDSPCVIKMHCHFFQRLLLSVERDFGRRFSFGIRKGEKFTLQPYFSSSVQYGL